jgi:hypothetical protein
LLLIYPRHVNLTENIKKPAKSPKPPMWRVDRKLGVSGNAHSRPTPTKTKSYNFNRASVPIGKVAQIGILVAPPRFAAVQVVISAPIEQLLDPYNAVAARLRPIVAQIVNVPELAGAEHMAAQTD